MQNRGKKHFLWVCKQRLYIIIYIISIFILPVLVYVSKSIYFKTFGRYNDNWLGFWGSYLGGILGGIATLMAVVVTIHNNNDEQDRKEENEKKTVIQRSAFIVHLDFQFTFENIVDFLLFFWKTESCCIDELRSRKNYEAYLKCRNRLNQFYFVEDFIYRVADLRECDYLKEDIKRIGEVYGHLMNIRKSLDVSKDDVQEDILQRAFVSMNSFIDHDRIAKDGGIHIIIDCQDRGVDVIKKVMKADYLQLLEKLETVSSGKMLLYK